MPFKFCQHQKITYTQKDDLIYIALNKQRQKPYEWGFSHISSVNYFWIMAWIKIINFTSQSSLKIKFTDFNFFQIDWLKQNHKINVEEVGDDHCMKRKAIVSQEIDIF
ncbi:unnamed protein product [Paramecium sonneborni]|uniref:Uncharacterized protein n=1 Tax=Paramecium sonneborni TaxID=65129 RepID=A0A8S1NPX8_9CILI|nr:unnamed protein product [Paramecium sonneborni]